MKPSPLDAALALFAEVPVSAYLPVTTAREYDSVRYCSGDFAEVWFAPDARPFAEGLPRAHFYFAPEQGPQFTRHVYTVNSWPVDVRESSYAYLVWVGAGEPEPDLESIRQIALRLFWPYPVPPKTWILQCAERMPNRDMRFHSEPVGPGGLQLRGGVAAGRLYFELSKHPSLSHHLLQNMEPQPLDNFIPELRASKQRQ